MADPARVEEIPERPMTPVTPLPAAARPPRPSVRERLTRALLRTILLVAIPAVAVLVGAYYWAIGGRFIETDNAYVRADKVDVSPEISGRVTSVAVNTNQQVAVGDVLFTIDNELAQITHEEAEAQLNMVRTEIGVLRASYWQMREQLTLAETQAAFFEREYRRQAELAERKVIPVVKVDRARHDMDMAIQEVAVRERDLAEILVRLGGNPDAPDEGFARFINARTKRDRAALDISRSTVYAPADGVIARVDLRPGTFVEPGHPVISLVESADLWLEANLRESDLEHVQLGQAATVRVDAYGGHEWSAKVVSFSPATGAEFSLLPPQNATGNWVKVVQRVPVRLRIEQRPDDPPLRLGMSVNVSIDTEFERQLPDFVMPVLAWISSFD
jgi:membrane fusion protein (multidrug efflux system)